MTDFDEEFVREAMWEDLAKTLGLDTKYTTRGRPSEKGKLRKNSRKIIKKAKRKHHETIEAYFINDETFRAQKLIEGWTRDTIGQLDEMAADVHIVDTDDDVHLLGLLEATKIVSKRLTFGLVAEGDFGSHHPERSSSGAAQSSYGVDHGNGRQRRQGAPPYETGAVLQEDFTKTKDALTHKPEQQSQSTQELAEARHTNHLLEKDPLHIALQMQETQHGVTRACIETLDNSQKYMRLRALEEIQNHESRHDASVKQETLIFLEQCSGETQDEQNKLRQNMRDEMLAMRAELEEVHKQKVTIESNAALLRQQYQQDGNR